MVMMQATEEDGSPVDHQALVIVFREEIAAMLMGRPIQIDTRSLAMNGWVLWIAAQYVELPPRPTDCRLGIAVLPPKLLGKLLAEEGLVLNFESNFEGAGIHHILYADSSELACERLCQKLPSRAEAFRHAFEQYRLHPKYSAVIDSEGGARQPQHACSGGSQ